MTLSSNFDIFSKLKADFKANFVYNNPKPILIVISYRMTSYFAQNNSKIIKWIGLPIRLLYRLFIEWTLGVEIPDVVKSGGGLTIHHGVGLVINPQVVLGKNVVLRHNTTLGHKTDKDGKSLGAPVIGNNVDLGANVVIIGNISIGENSVVGAGSVVVKDVPPNCIVVGNPARILRFKNGSSH